jgi:hypothetical protein
MRTEEQPTAEGAVSDAQRRRSVSLGDTSLSTQPEREESADKEPIAQEIPKQPLPGQRRPDAKGRCPNRQVAINGGCWAKVDAAPEDCHGNMYLYQGSCYLPMFTRGRVPTSAPPER